ncbi:MAG: hypothetical protein M2R45_00359 [Verrucomicrobia subdivision 3 bacterium]|nr:hypothetical protein [Limisphaerales bacterium]MCS1412883.1 hypothetical protein [Limisphaerales bacterium]
MQHVEGPCRGEESRSLKQGSTAPQREAPLERMAKGGTSVPAAIPLEHRVRPKAAEAPLIGPERGAPARRSVNRPNSPSNRVLWGHLLALR